MPRSWGGGRVYPHRNLTLKEAIVRRRHVRPTEIWAVRDVDLAIQPGESVGFVGRNGSGKTTLLRLIAGIFAPTEDGSRSAARSARSSNWAPASIPTSLGARTFPQRLDLRPPRKLVDERLDDIVAFSELEEFIDIPVRTYSSGMYMRLGFAIAVHIEADAPRRGVRRRRRGLPAEVHRPRAAVPRARGTLCFVSHDASAVERLCERAVLLTQGRVEYERDERGAEALPRQAGGRGEPRSCARVSGMGSGEVRVADVLVEGVGGPTEQFTSGDALVVRLRLVVEAPVDPPRLSSSCGTRAGLARVQRARSRRGGLGRVSR